MCEIYGIFDGLLNVYGMHRVCGMHIESGI